FIQASRTSGYTFRSTDIGAVLDLMIHDIDLVLSLDGTEVTDVSAIGVSVLGDHEDIASAQLTFASGCVAQLTASRVSYDAQRSMQVFTTRGFASLDFATGKATTVRPREDVLRRAFRVADLSADERERLRVGLFDELLVKETAEAPAVNAIDEEQQDFADAIRSGRSPRVSGAAGRDAVVVANRVLEKIAEHPWDGDATGRVGMFPTPALPILQLPAAAPIVPPPTRKAG
ncbi:MAG: Gfo/Idh/MocA family oxidoreductase, partial [Planctomycetota bacterium]